jgi:hypothetical protein
MLTYILLLIALEGCHVDVSYKRYSFLSRMLITLNVYFARSDYKI